MPANLVTDYWSKSKTYASSACDKFLEATLNKEPAWPGMIGEVPLDSKSVFAAEVLEFKIS